MNPQQIRIMRFVIIFSCLLGSAPLEAQNPFWSSQVRSSWVQNELGAKGDIVLVRNNGGCEIVVSAQEDAAVRQSAEFLAGDIEKISGFRPPLLAQASGGQCAIHLVTMGKGPAPEDVDAKLLKGAWEAYQVLTDGKDVWLLGSNSRGTAFAAYTLSERLGVDPLYLWTGYAPKHCNPLAMKQTRFVQGPPTFKFRGFFHDDEDILPRPFDDQGRPLQTGDVPLDWYKRYFETALRLRMNMVAPYVRVHRRYEVQKLASDWGLYFTSHHYDILLSNPYGLERFHLAEQRGVKPEWNWFTNKEGMLRYWRGGLEENKNLDVIWPVGMRGTADRPYTFPEGTTDEQKAQVFHDAILAQVDMARQQLPKEKTPLFHFTMYTEMLDQYRRNPDAFDLPADVIIVWPDDNDGHMRGLPATQGKWKHGVYYHLAYLGGNLSKQMTHIVSPATIADQFKKIVEAGATEFMLVNVSELREYVMGARMVADITWNAPDVYAQPNPSQRYATWWSREYFGDAAAPAVGGVYSRYFTLLDRPDRLWFAADAIENLLERLYHKVSGEAFSPTLDTDALNALQSRAPQLRAALAAEELIGASLPLSPRRFLDEELALGLQVDLRQTQAALLLAEAVSEPDAARMWQLVLQARTPLEQLEAELMRQEYPPFDRWYHETWIRSALSDNNPHRSYNNLRAFIASEGHGRLVREGPVGIGR
jgi:hypothetical protein